MTCPFNPVFKTEIFGLAIFYAKKHHNLYVFVVALLMQQTAKMDHKYELSLGHTLQTLLMLQNTKYWDMWIKFE